MRVRALALTSLAGLLASCATIDTGGPRVPACSTRECEVRAAAAAFVTAFNALDATRFTALWADDATVFFPQPPFPIRRVDGKSDVLLWFGRFLDAQRAEGRSPGVDPRDLDVRMIGDSGAVVTFHLGTTPERAARRTLVYRREAAGWRIVHLHGSALTAVTSAAEAARSPD